MFFGELYPSIVFDYVQENLISIDISDINNHRVIQMILLQLQWMPTLSLTGFPTDRSDRNKFLLKKFELQIENTFNLNFTKNILGKLDASLLDEFHKHQQDTHVWQGRNVLNKIMSVESMILHKLCYYLVKSTLTLYVLNFSEEM